MLEKDKNCIEFSMHTMMLTHKPYQEDTQIGITGMIPGREILADNLFDIPCDVVVVPKKEFEQLKKKLEDFSPVPECLVSANGWEESAKFWKKRYDDIFKLVGFSSELEVEDYLVNEAECDTLHEAILKLHDEVKYASDEWAKTVLKLTECEKENLDLKKQNDEYARKNQDLIVDSCGRKTVIEAYKRDIERWKEATGCPSPSAAKTLIESGMSYVHAYHEAQEENRKLTDDINSWKNVTGYSTPEDFLSAMINDKPQSLYSWQKATGCDTPDDAKKRIEALNKSIDDSEADYNHLLMTTGFESEGEIEDALDKCDHSTLRKALVDYEFDYEALLKLTGYKSEHDIRVMLNNSEQFVYKNMRELINSLKRKVKFIDSN